MTTVSFFAMDLVRITCTN